MGHLIPSGERMGCRGPLRQGREEPVGSSDRREGHPTPWGGDQEAGAGRPCVAGNTVSNAPT